MLSALLPAPWEWAKYTDNVYKMCEAVLRADLPDYQDLDVLAPFAEKHSRLFKKIVVQNLAVNVRDGTIPDLDNLDVYLHTNTILGKAIQDFNDVHIAYLQLEECRVRQQTNAEQQKEIEKRQAQMWKEKNAKRAALEKARVEKSRAGLGQRKKFTPEERARWASTRGTQPPKSC